MDPRQFDIEPFERPTLLNALKNDLTTIDQIESKPQFSFLLKYLESLNTKRILVEYNYVSKSYLVDFTNFYSTCFHEYGKFCKRVHFFSSEFCGADFIDSYIKQENKKIWDSYLGYIVVRPLPYIVIGATLLAPPPKTDQRSFFPTQEYIVYLFGKELKITTLAFQEQDSVVGACASSALWTAFHKTSKLFQTPLPPPSDITKSAKNLYLHSGRTYPNNRLDQSQIGNSIEAVGLVAELRNSAKIKQVKMLKSFIYAYNRMGLPILLGFDFLAMSVGHVVTITGLEESREEYKPKKGVLNLRSEAVEKLFVHDDQQGPFSTMTFLKNGKFETNWESNTFFFFKRKKIARVLFVSVPLHNEIKLPYEEAFPVVKTFDLYCRIRFEKPTGLTVYWDMYLSLSNVYKEEIYDTNTVLANAKYKILTTPLPKHIWIIKGYVSGGCVIEFVLDATQIARSDFCLLANVYNDSLAEILLIDLFQSSLKDLLVDNKLSDKNFMEKLQEGCDLRLGSVKT